MTDREIIEDAYAGTVQIMFDSLFNSYTQAADANERDMAEQRFRRGVAIAQEVRDRAIALLP